MKYKSIFLLFAAAIGVGGAAQAAATYSYSYRFDSGEKVSGRFDGDADGNIIRNLTNITINIDRPAGNFSGSPPLSSYLALGGGKWDVAQGGVASLDGRESAFVFVDPSNPDNYMYLYSASRYYEANAIRLQHGAGGEDYFFLDTYRILNWSISPVPEPSSIAMLLTGMLLISGVGRRRQC